MAFPGILAIFLIFITSLACAETRNWTSVDGRVIEATILELNGEIVRLRTSRGEFELSLDKLSTADQLFAKDWANKMAAAKPSEEKGKPQAMTLGNFNNLKLGEWPQYVVAELSLDQIEIVESKDDDGKEQFLYRTPHFEFHSPDRLSTSVVREFARIFEATYAFVDQMPIGLAPGASENGFYKTKLYMSKDDYYSDGGMPGSGGMFTWRRRGQEMSGMIKVPLSNLGVEYTGTRFIVDHKKRSTTLTHEIVHQVMMRWLASAMPVWLSEGLAEVVSSQDYNNGRFKLNSMNRSVAEEVTRGRGRDYTMLNLERLMTITHGEWSSDLASGRGGRNYDSANILAYYFLRLDGEGNGAHLVEFLKEITSGNRGDDGKLAREKHLLRERSYEQLEKDLADAWRSEGLKIEFTE